ncbi:MAG TPA: AAA family ATPase, partial [Kangiella sp.]
YVMDLINATRQSPDFAHGLSPRGGLALIGAAKAWAFLDERDYVLPEDIQRVFVPTVAHRLQSVKTSSEKIEVLVEQIIHDTPISA